MDNFFCLVALAILGLEGLVRAEEEVELRWLNQPKFIQVEDGKQNLEMSCFINQDYGYLMEHNVDILFRRPWMESLDDQEVHLFHMSKPVEANPTFYEIKSDRDEALGGIVFHFKILTVRPEDDGFFVCKATDLETEVELIVIKPLPKVTIQFESELTPAPISVTQEEPLLVKPGLHSVKCTAEGSNPRPEEVKLIVAGNEIPSGDIMYTEMHDISRQYSASIETEIDVGYRDHNGEKITCRGVGPTQETLEVSVPIQVATRQSKINCSSTKAYPGKKMVSINCVVHHEGITVDSFKYRIMKGDELLTIPAGDTITVGGKEVKVQLTDLGQEMTDVKLTFAEVDFADFNSKIHLVVESAGGYLDEGEAIDFVKIAGNPKFKGNNNNGSPVLAASLMTVVLAYVLAKVL